MRPILRTCFVIWALLLCRVGAAGADSLHIGWATTDITPDRPVALVGQLHKRISQKMRDPLTATALALESRGQDGRREQAILISCDVLYIRKAVQDRLRQIVKPRLPDFDVEKLLLNATHTHTAPGFADEDFGTLYDVSADEGVMTASEYGEFFLERVAEVAVEAWQSRKAGGMSWALGHAVVGLNRRAHYFNGSAAMYGSTNRADFANIEGYEDHGLEMLFFWDESHAPTGIVINLACTAQETEGLSEVSADFWHDVRLELRHRLSRDIFILPQCAAAGDLSPHLLFRARAEEVMRQRRGLSNRQEIARRIGEAVEDALPLAGQDIQAEPVFKHTVARVALPPQEPPVSPFYTTDTITPIEFHVIRLGDIALATNPFELFLDYGVRIKARSPATLTLLVQLACQHCGYLPTERAVQGGGYSADKFVVGPQGGQVLVDETVARLAALWDRADKPYVVLERGDIRAVIVNNEAVNDDILPNHQAGYSGVASLTHRRQDRNLFVPMYAGLNFEHIHDGTVQPRDILFEPRHAPMAIERTGAYTVELHQPPTPHWQLESRLQYELLEDGAIEMTLECIPRARTFQNGYVGLFFASYIHQPESLDIHFLGHPAEELDSEARWIRGVTPEHGVHPTHPAFDDRRDFPHDPEFPLSLVFNLSNYRYREPWYYGVSHGMALVQMFRPGDRVRLSQSPSGAGAGNPAWDFQWFIGDPNAEGKPTYEVGKRYRFVMRAMYLPFASTEQLLEATAAHRAALLPPSPDPPEGQTSK